MENLRVTFNNVHGDLKADKIFIVTKVDTEDSEDSSSDIWFANDEDHLYELVKEEYLGDDFEDDDPFKLGFDDDWGISILYTEIGTILQNK